MDIQEAITYMRKYVGCYTLNEKICNQTNCADCQYRYDLSVSHIDIFKTILEELEHDNSRNHEPKRD